MIFETNFLAIRPLTGSIPSTLAQTWSSRCSTLALAWSSRSRVRGSSSTLVQPQQARPQSRMTRGPGITSRTSQSTQGLLAAWTSSAPWIWAVRRFSSQGLLFNSWKSLSRTLQSDKDPSAWLSQIWTSRTCRATLCSTRSWARCSIALLSRTATLARWSMTGTRAICSNRTGAWLLPASLMRRFLSWRVGYRTSPCWNLSTMLAAKPWTRVKTGMTNLLVFMTQLHSLSNHNRTAQKLCQQSLSQIS